MIVRELISKVALALAIIALFSACSGGGSDSEITGDTGSTPPTAPTANRAPSISGSPPGSIVVGEAFSFTPTASDPDGDRMTFSVQNRPSWIDSFNTSTGQLAGTPDEGDVGTYSQINITVSDGQLSDSLSPFSVTVDQVAVGSVTLNWEPPTQNTDGSPLTDLAGYAFYYGTSSGSYPNRIQLNNPGLTTYVVENLSPATYYFVAVAIKSNGVESNYSNEALKVVM